MATCADSDAAHHSFVAALSGHLPPNLGIVGPACDFGEDSTSVFVHHTHWRIFEVLGLYILAVSAGVDFLVE